MNTQATCSGIHEAHLGAEGALWTDNLPDAGRSERAVPAGVAQVDGRVQPGAGAVVAGGTGGRERRALGAELAGLTLAPVYGRLEQRERSP